MKAENRETLQRASGILEGLSASGDISDAITNMIMAVSEMLDAVLAKEASDGT